MTYQIKFRESAAKEWEKLDHSIRRMFAKKLEERALNPRVESDRLRSLSDCYKIKLRQVGYRLVYQVIDDILVVAVVSVGKRDKLIVYAKAEDRLN